MKREKEAANRWSFGRASEKKIEFLVVFNFSKFVQPLMNLISRKKTFLLIILSTRELSSYVMRYHLGPYSIIIESYAPIRSSKGSRLAARYSNIASLEDGFPQSVTRAAGVILKQFSD